MSVNCEYCDKPLSSKYTLKRHYDTCKIKIDQDTEIKEQELTEKYGKAVRSIYEERIKTLEKEKADTIKTLEKEKADTIKDYERKLQQKEKALHDLEINLADKSATLKVIQEIKPTIINHNNIISNSNNHVNSNNNNIFNMLKPINQLIESGMSSINDNFVYSGVNGITNHIENETEILNNLFNSNKQRGTITYRKSDNPKLIKDERATDLVNDIVKSIPLDKFDENRLGNLGIIHTDFMNLKTGNTDDVKKGISKFIVNKSKSEEALKNNILDTSPIKKKILLGLANYVFNHAAKQEHMIYYGFDSIINFLFLNNYIDCSMKVFQELFPECMQESWNYYKLLYESELKKMGDSNQYYESTKEELKKIELFVNNSFDITDSIKRMFDHYNISADDEDD